MQPDIVPLQPEDVNQVVDLVSAAMPVECISPEKFARHILLDPNYRDEGALVAKVEAAVTGFVYAAARAIPLDEVDARRGYVTAIAVDGRFRRQGLGSHLLAAAEAFLRRCGRTEVMVASYAPAYFIPGVDLAAYPAAVELFKRRGYEEVSRPIAMTASLWNLTDPPFVTDARQRLAREHADIKAFSPPMTQPVLRFARTEFGADWEWVYRDAIQSILRGDASSARIVVALQAGKVLGISHHDGERFGPIGVAASARGRGIGHALMYETLHAQRRAGLRAAWFLWSDDRTADKLYRSAGFVECRRYVILRRRYS